MPPSQKLSDIVLRDYQVECKNAVEKAGAGSHLCQMATGLGKTVVFTNLVRPSGTRTLILSHRQELVHQPAKYYSCPVGFEEGTEHSSGEEIVSASVQSMVRRLHHFQPDTFYRIIWDEAHHAAAKSYRKIVTYFRPYQNIGFTATPQRGDHVRLSDVFEDIIFERDIKWGIENHYLSNIYCRRVNIGFGLKNVHTQRGDFKLDELETAMEGTAGAVAEAYRTCASGSTLIFTVSVHEAYELSKLIPDSVVVTAQTGRSDREKIIQDFTMGKILCLINCMIFTEGTDIPRVETVMIARPTKSNTLYAQMVGRGLRLYPGKTCLNLIDCVGVSKQAQLCTAPSLLGLDLSQIPESRLQKCTGNILELPNKVAMAADCPECWVMNTELVNLWADNEGYNLHNVNWVQMPDGSLICNVPKFKRPLIVGPTDDLGRVIAADGKRVPIQEELNRAYWQLHQYCSDCRVLWDLNSMHSWAFQPPTKKQLTVIRNKYPLFNTKKLTRLQASQILQHIFGKN